MKTSVDRIDRKEEYFRPLLKKYLRENIPTDFEEFKKILPNAKLWQLKSWRETMIYRSGRFSPKHLEALDKKIIETIPRTGKREAELVLDIGRTANPKSQLYSQVNEWVGGNFVGILSEETKISQLLNWFCKASYHSRAASLIKKRTLEILPDFLESLPLEPRQILKSLEQLLEFQQEGMFQSKEAQAMITKKFLQVLDKIEANSRNVEGLINLREKYRNTPLLFFLHKKLAEILLEVKGVNLRIMIQWEEKVSQIDSNWNFNKEIGEIIEQKIKDNLRNLKISELYLNSWILQTVEGKFRIPEFLKVPLFEKILDWVDDKNLPEFTRT